MIKFKQFFENLGGKEKRDLQDIIDKLKIEAEYRHNAFKETGQSNTENPFVRFIHRKAGLHFYEPLETFEQLNSMQIITLYHSYLDKEQGEYMITHFGGYKDNVLTFYIVGVK